MTLNGQTLQQRLEWLREDLQTVRAREKDNGLEYCYGYLESAVSQFLIDADAIAAYEKARKA